MEEYLKIIYGKDFSQKKFKYQKINILRMFFNNIKINTTFVKRGFNSALQQEKSLFKFARIVYFNSSPDVIYNARCISSVVSIFGKIVRQTNNCLERAITQQASLITLGYDVKLVIGKSMNYVNPDYDFHAWIEIDNVPINENNSVLEQYNVIFRFSPLK